MGRSEVLIGQLVVSDRGFSEPCASSARRRHPRNGQKRIYSRAVEMAEPCTAWNGETVPSLPTAPWKGPMMPASPKFPQLSTATVIL